MINPFGADDPLEYTSGNASGKRAVIGTTLLAILNGQTRHAHINALRQDRVSAEVLNVKKLFSKDSVRRALLKEKEDAWDGWLRRHERAGWDPLLTESDVLWTSTTRSSRCTGLWALLDGLPADKGQTVLGRIGAFSTA